MFAMSSISWKDKMVHLNLKINLAMPVGIFAPCWLGYTKRYLSHWSCYVQPYHCDRAFRTSGPKQHGLRWQVFMDASYNYGLIIQVENVSLIWHRCNTGNDLFNQCFIQLSQASAILIDVTMEYRLGLLFMCPSKPCDLPYYHSL